MAMDLKIEMIETCSCNMMCPCWYGVRELMVMDQGWCGTVMALRFLEGSAEGVDLGGRTAILGFDFPGPTLFDGNGTARIYIEDGVSPEQVEAIEAVLQARNGGPMAILASLIARWLPTVTAGMVSLNHSLNCRSGRGCFTSKVIDTGSVVDLDHPTIQWLAGSL